MAASIAEVFNAVNAYNTLALQALEFGSSYRPDLTLPSYAYGPAGRVAKASAPQIAWLFGRNKFGPPLAIRAPRTAYGIQHRPIHTRWQAFEVHVWAPKNVFSPVKRAGSMLGHLSLSGTPTAIPFAVVQIQITVAGVVGVAQFQYSLDGGASFSSNTATGTNVALGSSGINVTFAIAGAGTQLALGDFFTFVAYSQQVADYATCETMVETFIASVRYMINGSYELGEGEWSGEAGEELFQMGAEFVLPLQVRTPVSEVMLSGDVGLAKITSIQQTDQIGATSTTP